MSLPVQVKPVRRRGQPVEVIETRSTDFSAQGLYIVLSGEFELGSELDLEIALPRALTTTDGVRIRCKAKVVRVQPNDSDGTVGIGAKIGYYEFIQQPKTASDATTRS